jgi:hypothetical protein
MRTVAARAGIAWRLRAQSTASRAIAPITAARSTLASGWTTTTKAARVAPASTTATRGPSSPAASRTEPQTMVTLAPETAVRCVRPAVRNAATVPESTAEVSPSTKPGSIAA